MKISPVHLGIESNEAIQSKKDLLSMELEIINLLKLIREYKLKRERELRLKMKLKRKTLLTLTEIRKIQKAIPKIKMNDIKEREEKREIKEKIKKSKEELKNNELEEELEKIKEKLRALQ